MHAWFVQVIGVPHIPDMQVCTAEVPEHCVALPKHTPEHIPIVHVSEQATAVPHVPSESHVCTPLPEHRIAVGLQTVASPLLSPVVASTPVASSPLVEPEPSGAPSASNQASKAESVGASEAASEPPSERGTADATKPVLKWVTDPTTTEPSTDDAIASYPLPPSCDHKRVGWAGAPWNARVTVTGRAKVRPAGSNV
jgi:hypothetical protein